MKKIIILFLLSIISNYALLASIQEGCNKKEIQIYYLNGMFNTDVEAAFSMHSLENKLLMENNQNGSIDRIFPTVKISYNINEPVLEQIYQVVKQKNADLLKSYWYYLSKLDAAPEVFRNIALDEIKKTNAKTYLTDNDFKEIMEEHRDKIRKEKISIIIVSHSQGNFYSNAIYETIVPKEIKSEDFKILGVATPTSYIPQGNKYLTLKEDKIIKLIPLSLAANITNNITEGFNHNFVESYLNGKNSGKKIIEIMTNYIKIIPTKSMEETFWSSPPDLNTDGYLHSSLIKMLKFIRGLDSKKIKRKLTTSECLAISLFAEGYRVSGEPCNERSLKHIEKWTDYCKKEWWFNIDANGFSTCSLYGVSPMTTCAPLFFDNLYSQYPECEFGTVEEFRKKVHPEDVDNAIKLIREPPEK